MKIQSALIIISALFLFACNEGKNSTDASGSNTEIVKQLYASFNKHDWEAMAALYADTAEFKDPAFGPAAVKQTKQQIIEKYTELGSMFPDVRDEVLAIYPSGEKHVIVEFVSTGSADTTKFELPICTIFTIENGKISKDYTYYDNF